MIMRIILFFAENVVEKALKAIRGGASIVTDTQMGKAGINKNVLPAMAERYIALCRMTMWRRRQKETNNTGGREYG